MSDSLGSSTSKSKVQPKQDTRIDDYRLTSDFMKLTTTYELSGFCIFYVTNDKLLEFIRLLRNIYSGKDGMMKMFVDKLTIKLIQKEESKVLKVSQTLFDLDSLKFKKDISIDKLFNFNLEYIRYGIKIEKEIIKVAKNATEKAKRSLHVKRHYVYLLLDPTKFSADILATTESSVKTLFKNYDNKKTLFDLKELIGFQEEFLESIFYVGLGQGPRSMVHFKFARNEGKYKKQQNFANSTKIREIWDENPGKGPIVLHCIEGISVDEAKYREAYLIHILKTENYQINNNNRPLKKDTRKSNEKKAFVCSFLFKSYLKFIFEDKNEIMKDSIDSIGDVQTAGSFASVNHHNNCLCECENEDYFDRGENPED